MHFSSRIESVGLARADRRLSALRWGMLLLCAGVLTLARAFQLPLAWPLLIQALLTLALINGLQSLARRHSVPPIWLLRIGLVADVLALSEVLAFSGGAANPLASLYLPPVLFAALLSPGLFAWCVALLAILAYGVLFYWHLPWPLVEQDAAYAFHAHQSGMWLTFALSAMLMTGFISYLAHQLSVRDDQLQAARETQMRDEQLVALGMQAAVAAHALSTPLNTLTLLADEWGEIDPPRIQPDELQLMKGQLRACREALTRLKHQSQTGPLRVQLFAALTERLHDWRALRPDVTLQWQPPESAGPWVWLDSAFWPALFNLIDNASDAGGGVVEIAAAIEAGQLRLDIVNREGCLSPAQLAAAGLAPLPSGKAQGMGLGVMLTHATLARLGGVLSLDNRSSGGVLAQIRLPLNQDQA